MANIAKRPQPSQYCVEKHFGGFVPVIKYASPAPSATDLLDVCEQALTTITKYPDWNFVAPIATLRSFHAILKTCTDPELGAEFEKFLRDKRFNNFIPLDSTVGKVMLKDCKRGFDHVYLPNNDAVILPQRDTPTSPGYTFKLPYDVKMVPGKIIEIPLGIKAYMEETDYLAIRVKNLPGNVVRLVSSPYIVEWDALEDALTGGEIIVRISLQPWVDKDTTIPQGTALLEGVFSPYALTGIDVPGWRGKTS